MDNEIIKIVLTIVLSKKFIVPEITLIITAILIKIIKSSFKKLLNTKSHSLETKRKNTVFSLLSNLLTYIIIIFALVVILNSWGINITGILAGLGVAGVVAGLALQDALKDIIMGCNIIMDNYYVVGDTITVNGFTGEVIEFGLKNTKLKNANNQVLILANREITGVINLSQKNSKVQIKVPVAYEELEENVEKAFNKIFKEVDKLNGIVSNCKYLGIDDFENSSIIYIFEFECKALNRIEIKRKTLSIIKRIFDAENIKIPYPQVEVHNGYKI